MDLTDVIAEIRARAEEARARITEDTSSLQSAFDDTRALLVSIKQIAVDVGVKLKTSDKQRKPRGPNKNKVHEFAEAAE